MENYVGKRLDGRYEIQDVHWFVKLLFEVPHHRMERIDTSSR